MNTYWVIWTYIANYSEKPLRVQAASPQDAVRALFQAYSDDFQAKARVFVFDHEPVMVGRASDAARKEG